jgi:hypothetical protein
MEQWEMLSKVIRYQKAVTDSAFTIISIFQNSGEQVLKTALDQQSWIPDQEKKDFLIWSNNYLQITTNMKAFFNKSYEEAERFMEQPGKTAREQQEPPAQQEPSAQQKSPEEKSSPKLKQKVSVKKPAAARRKPSSPKQKEEKTQRKAPVRTSKNKEEASKRNS